MDLPVVFSHYVLSKNTHSTEEYLMKMQNGDAFLSRYNTGKGKVYLSSAPLNTGFSNFAKHALFVPVLYKMAIHSQPIRPLCYTIGKEESIEIPAGDNSQSDNVFHIKNTSSDFDMIPEYRTIEGKTSILIHNRITEAGNYYLYRGSETIAVLSFNYNRKESNLSCYSPEELNRQMEVVGAFNFSLVERRAVEVGVDDFVRPFIGPGQVAGELGKGKQG